MMELPLNRKDYFQVGVTSPKTTKLLPSSELKGQQKIVVADNSGVLHCFGIKKGEVQTVFKTIPESKISRVELGGLRGSVQDKIFIASSNKVMGYTKKGKQFLVFDTNMTEPIASMSILGNDLFVSGKYIYNHYFECQDRNHYLCADAISDLVVLNSRKKAKLFPVLGCQDRVLRVLQDQKCICEVEISGPPSTLSTYENGNQNDCNLLYGTLDGKVGLINFNDMNTPTSKWEIPNNTKSGSISCLDTYDITGDGVKDLLIGRNDGQIDVYMFDENEDPVFRYSYSCNESLTSLQGGVVGNSGYDEILATTYTGWIFGLTFEPQDKRIDPNFLLIPEESAQKIIKLKQEVEELQQKVLRERERYQQISQSDILSVSAVPYFKINDSFVLCHDDASYMLTIEVQTAIDNILLQSNVPIDLLDSEKNSAVVSYSPCDPENGNFLLATFRCQANITRLEVKIRTIEGQYGMIQAYITPRVQPKCCQLRQYHIKPLSLYRRSNTVNEASVPLNTLTLKGPFSLGEMHSWIVSCLPEVPERIPVEDQISFFFMSTFIGTILVCRYAKGEATFSSDNISTISILKDFITKEATQRKISISISSNINEQSIEHTLRLIAPKLEERLMLSKRVQLIDGLRHLKAHESDLSFLSPEYTETLDNADELMQEFKRQPCFLERIYGMIADLYIDVFKSRGINVKGRVPSLLNLLNEFDFDRTLEFFNTMP